MNAQQTAADLLSAANHIETYGLTKGEYGEAGGPCCTLGAIRVAVWGSTRIIDMFPEHEARYDNAVIALANVLPGGGWVTTWTDQGERTQEQVSGKLREAAKAVFPNE